MRPDDRATATCAPHRAIARVGLAEGVEFARKSSSTGCRIGRRGYPQNLWIKRWVDGAKRPCRAAFRRLPKNGQKGNTVYAITSPIRDGDRRPDVEMTMGWSRAVNAMRTAGAAAIDASMKSRRGKPSWASFHRPGGGRGETHVAAENSRGNTAVTSVRENCRVDHPPNLAENKERTHGAPSEPIDIAHSLVGIFFCAGAAPKRTSRISSGPSISLPWCGTVPVPVDG